jgi:hypothetical protein
VEHRFDDLAKALAGGVSRREVLRRLGGGLAGALLASLGIGRAWSQSSGFSCDDFCTKQGLTGSALSTCRRQCRACVGEGGTVCSASSSGGVTCCAQPNPACCGTGCCTSPKACCNDICCETGTRCCGGKCCPDTDDCLNGEICCPPGFACGGAICCGSRAPICCPGGSGVPPSCVPNDVSNCGTCGNQCRGSEICCPGPSAAASACCPAERCCPGWGCCPAGTHCVGNHCEAGGR